MGSAEYVVGPPISGAGEMFNAGMGARATGAARARDRKRTVATTRYRASPTAPALCVLCVLLRALQRALRRPLRRGTT